MNVAYHILDKFSGEILRSGVCTYEEASSLYNAETEEFMEAPILEEPANPIFQDPILTAQGLDFEKLNATRMIDQFAETIRGKYITLGSGQAMVYQQKRDEAELVAADSEVNPSLVPHIAYEANLNQIPLLDQAAIVLTMSEQWKAISAYIEMARLGAKAQVMTLETVEEIRTFMATDHFAGL